MESEELDYKKNDVICREGDPSSDLYYLKGGKLLICTINGTQVKAIARIEPGEFIGELSFFDGKPRASHIVAIEDSILVRIPKEELSNQLPTWYMQAGIKLTAKIRLLDGVIHQANIRRGGTEDQKPLTIEEQRQIYAVLVNQ